MTCATCDTVLDVVVGRPGHPQKFCAPCRAARVRDQARQWQRRHYAAHKDAMKLRRSARAEARERGVTLEEVLAAWGKRA